LTSNSIISGLNAIGESMKKITFVALKTFLLSLVLFAFQTLLADSPCKGLSESQCKANPDCTHVTGFTKKDGTKVDDYCRAKPGKGDADNDKPAKKEKVKKDKDEEKASKPDKDNSDKADKKEKKDKKKKDEEKVSKPDKDNSDKADKKEKKDKKKKDDSDKPTKKEKKDKK
jgi:outer membrane biosynthesis protein TonB